jgi:hypothetical protein
MKMAKDNSEKRLKSWRTQSAVSNTRLSVYLSARRDGGAELPLMNKVGSFSYLALINE